jgi:hypothetical protein
VPKPSATFSEENIASTPETPPTSTPANTRWFRYTGLRCLRPRDEDGRTSRMEIAWKFVKLNLTDIARKLRPTGHLPTIRNQVFGTRLEPAPNAAAR